MKTVGKLLISATLGLIGFGALIFGPAGTFDYWQAWVFLAAFTLATWPPSLYLLRSNPAALDRRMRIGPLAETRPVQRGLVAVIFVCFPATLVVSALDHRFGWSAVPTEISLLGDALMIVGLGAAMLVVIQNGYAAATITVEAGQPLVDTGLYGVVRHPMYAANIALMAGIPLALDSYWGLPLIVPGLLVLVVRILDEEALLAAELPGYAEYRQRVRYRLLPGVW